MSTPTPLDPTPWNQLDADLKAWAEAQMEKQQAEEMLQKLLALVAAMKDPQLAFMICMQQIMPQMLAVQDSGAGVLGAANDVDTDVQKFLTAIQNFFNEGGNISPQDAQKMTQYVDQLEAQLKAELAKAKIDPNSTPLDAQDLQTMIQAIDDFKKGFGGDWTDPNKMQWDMQQMFNPDNNTNIWASILKEATNDLQMINQASSSMSTQTGTLISYATENFKQVMGIVQDCFKLWGQTVAGFVRNQISH